LGPNPPIWKPIIKGRGQGKKVNPKKCVNPKIYPELGVSKIIGRIIKEELMVGNPNSLI